MKSGRKDTEQIGEVRVLNSFRGGRIPALQAGQILCPVCQMPAKKLPDDGRPGARYYHDGRRFVCRSQFPPETQELPNA